MLTLYVVCFAAGSLLIALSVLGGGDFEAEADMDVDLGDAGEGVAAAGRFFSVRGVIFGTAFFGLTGSLFTLLRVGSILTLAFAIAWGVVAAASIQRLMGYLSRTENGAVSDKALEGSKAQVIVDIGDEQSGKISIAGVDRTLQFIARPHAEAQARRFGAGEEVVIVEVQEGTAYVVGATFLG
jgi:membrane protein implicated in regulation of membrane protease activity